MHRALSSVRPARTVLVALTALLSLPLAGLVAPAVAAPVDSVTEAAPEPASIAGTFVLPDVGERSSGDEVSGAVTVSATPLGGTPTDAVDAPVALDGGFVVTGLAAGVPYRLEFADGFGVLGGWFAGAGRPLQREESAAVPVRAPVSGLVVTPAVWASVSGTVALPEGAGDLAPVTISAHGGDGDPQAPPRADEVTVADDGSFVLDRLVPGEEYSLRLSDPASGDPQQAGTPRETTIAATGGRAVIAPAADVLVSPTADAVEPAAEVVASTAITGTLVVPAGTGFSYATVSAYRWVAEGGYWTLDVSNFLGLGDGTDFSLPVTDPAGRYRLRVDGLQDFVSGWWAGAGVPVTFDAAGAVELTAGQTGIEVPLRVGGSLSGTIRAPQGSTLPASGWVGIQAWRRTPTGWASDGTYTVNWPDLNGPIDFRIGGLDPTVTYRLQVIDYSGVFIGGYYTGTGGLADAVDGGVDLGVPRAGLDLTLRAAVVISGTVVVPAGSAGGSMSVTAYRRSDDGTYWQYVKQVTVDSATYTFSIPGLASGVQYTLGLTVGGGDLLDGYYVSDDEVLVPVNDGTTRVVGGRTGVVLRPPVGTTISGTLRLSTGYVAPDVPWVWASSSIYEGAGVELDADGSFVLRRIRPGQLNTLSFYDGDGGFVDGDYAGPDSRLAAYGLGVLVPAGAAGLRAVGERPAYLSGTISAPAGPGIDEWGGERVLTLHDPGSGALRESVWGALPEGGAPGSFTSYEVRSGSYKIGFNRQSGQSLYAGTFYTAKPTTGPVLLADADVVSVAAGQDITGLDVAMRTCATVSGTVTLPAGLAGSSRLVFFNDQDPDVVTRAGSTDGGAFTMTGLLPGDYHVQVQAFGPGGYQEFGLQDVHVPGCVDVAGVALGAGQAVQNVTAPKVTGTAQSGKTLTANPGTWSPSSVTKTYQWLRDEVAILGAAGSTYVLTAGDIGHRFSVRVQASAAGYVAGVAASAQTAVVTGLPITRTAVPTVSGTAKVGAKLTATAGTWSVTGLTVGYQWLRAGSPISGAIAATYTAVAADKDKQLSVLVTVGKPGYVTVSATSVLTAKVVAGTFTSSVKPKVTGTAKVGAKLTASAGTWSPTGGTVKYQWLRAGAAISGATASTYTATATDKGKTIAVKVTVSKSGYTTTSATSAATAAVVSGTFTVSTKPSVTGTAKVGSTLTAAPGTWSPTGGTVTYQWLRAGTAISGATAKTYVLTASDKGKAISVKVTNAKSGYTTASATSAATAAVAAGTFTTSVAPKVTGTAKVGSTLTAAPGTWSPTGGTVKYQWLRAGAAISGATAKTYKLVSADKGKTISVTITVSKSGYTTASATSGTVKVA